MKNINKSLSLVLVFVLLLSVFPFNVVYAVEENTTSTQTQKTEEFVLPDIVPEAEAAERGYIGRSKTEEKDNYTFVFENSDNTRTMRVYSHPVKYTDKDGNIKDITLDIQSRAGGGFETKDNSIKTTFGAKLSDGIRLQHENVDIKLIPANKNITPVLSEDKQTVTYTLDTKTSLEYSLTYMGFKEDIVVSEYTGQTEYEFLLYTNGLTVKEEMGSYYLADSEGNRKANIGDIIIFTADERNNTLGSLSCIEIKENQIYGLTIHVDEEYLKDEKTVYPIRIDPTFEITSATTEGAIEDVTVYTGTEYYSGTSGILYLGTSNNLTYRILMKFPNLDLTGITAAQITNATVEFRDVMCQSVQVAMECRYYTGGETDWSESIATYWAMVGGDSCIGNLIDTKTIYYGNGNEGSDINRYSFNITNAAKSWANGVYSPQQGFIFKAADESFSSTEDRLKYFGSYNRSDYRTSFTLQYTDYTPAITLNATSVDILEGATRTLTATTTPAGSTVTWSTSNSNVATVSSTGVITAKKAGSATIYARMTDNGRTYTATCTVYVRLSNGIYYFNNKSNGYRIQFNNSLSYNENTPLCVASAGTSVPTERYAFFKVEYLGKGLYSIRSMFDNKMGWTRSSTSVLSTTIGTLNSTVPTTAKWYIKYNSDGYYIYSVSGTAYTVTSPAAPGSALTLASYASSNALQKWSLNRITTTYNGVEIIDKVNTLIVGESFDFSAVVYSSLAGINGQISMSWSVTNGTGIATIDSTTGELTGVSPGTVTVTVTYPYTPSINWTDSCEVQIEHGWIYSSKPEMYLRSDWDARSVEESRLVSRTRDPQRIIVHHSADKFSSTNIDDAISEIQRIQNMHMDNKSKCDIAYHFIIDPSGRIWQGALIDGYQRGHSTGYYDDIGVVVLGDFESRIENLWNPDVLNQQQKDALEALAKWLCYEYDLPVIEAEPSITPITTHRMVGDTECPGDNLAEWVEDELYALVIASHTAYQ